MEEIEVTVQSSLSSDEKRGRFRIRVSPKITVGDLLKLLCREAGTSLHKDYCLRSKEHGILVRTETLAASNVQDGTFLHWTSSGLGRKCLSWRNQYCLFAAVSILIGILGIVVFCSIRFKGGSHQQSFAIVFDAGSSHTSMFIYVWEASKLNGTAVAVQYGQKCDVDGEGLSDFEEEPDLAGESLHNCIDEAEKMIPKAEHSHTLIYLGATAGMRLMSQTNYRAANEILESVRFTFQISPFKFVDPFKSVRIINGTEEGCFSWITSNYVTNAFKVTPPGAPGMPAYTIVPTIGAMDLGGASTEITFVPKNIAIIPNDYRKELQLFGHIYTVYTYSYLCYGVREVAKLMFAHLIKSQPGKTEFSHPCLPTGFRESMAYNDIVNPACYHEDLNTTAKSFIFIGTSNGDECYNSILNTLFKIGTCEYSSCSFNGIYQPEVTGPFYAFSSFYHVSSFLNLSESFTLNEFTDAMDYLCSRTWAELQEWPATTKQRENLHLFCLKANYIHTLLFQGYKFTNNLWKSINFVEKVSLTEIGWTLGFVLNESIDYPKGHSVELISSMIHRADSHLCGVHPHRLDTYS
uniref:Uncharacterized protein n=1 Tax=Arion vulgaris TaxID=1028688 RepID=A0A0B6ZGS7_9EUPU